MLAGAGLVVPTLPPVRAPIQQVANPQALARDARLVTAAAAGLGSWVRAQLHHDITAGWPALEMLKNPQSVSQMSSADLAGMAHRILHDPAIPAPVKSHALLQIATAHGTEAGAIDGIVSRTGDGNLLVKALQRQDRKQYVALLSATQPKRGDWSSWDGYMDRATDTRVADGTRVETYIDGPAAFQAEYDAIDHARRFVNLSIYIFNSDKTGWDYAQHLADAAARGVQVRVMVDDYGSRFGAGNPVDPNLYKFMQSHGVKLVKIQDGPMFLNLSHRKILVTDDGQPGSGIVGFTGGMNIADWHADSWHDVFCRLQGPGATDLDQLFLAQWQQAGQAPPAAEAPQPTFPGGSPVRVVGHQGGHDINMKLAYMRAIDTSSKSIDIADPYFTDADVFNHLVQAA
ncbi:MAG TPA: phospholipase D-like domain-containing protein, partial [Candidatus Xenobia bacterium]